MSSSVAARESGRRSSPDSGPRRRLLTLVVVIVTLTIWNLQLYAQRSLNADVIGRLEATVHSTTEYLEYLRLEVDALQTELHYARWSEQEGTRPVADLLRTYEVRHLVTGRSSPRPAGSIQSRFGGRILLIEPAGPRVSARSASALRALASDHRRQVSLKFTEQFQQDWLRRWMEKELGERSTHYSVVQENGNSVLLAESKSSASALWRSLAVHPVESGTVSWRWKVEKSLAPNPRERTKEGDDYAARLLVVFDPNFPRRTTRALSYVWAASETVGSLFSNPYSGKVATIVIESGDEQAGEWVSEERDFVEDYRRAFGQAPQMVAAVAIVVDTDNTHSEATAWFDDIVVEVESSAFGARTSELLD